MPQPVRGLYVIVDPDACKGRSPVEIARQAIEGGARTIQWRDKRREKGEQLEDARSLARMCREHGVVFLVNDHADLAHACGADGVHLGQHDLRVEDVRPLLGPGAIIGVSTNNTAEARAAEQHGANYIAVGAIFPTNSKEHTRPADLDRIGEVKAGVGVPVVAIGGISAANIQSVVDAGADAAAVISAVCSADAPVEVARKLARAFTRDGSPVDRAERKRRLAIAVAQTLQERDREGFLDLFAPDGLIQDPVDAPPHVGRAAIGAWWERLMVAQQRFDFRPRSLHVVGDEAAYEWDILHDHGGHDRVAHGVAILGFDRDTIVSVFVYWQRQSPESDRFFSLIERYVAAFTNKDRAGFISLFSLDAVQQDPVDEPPRIGHTQIGEWWDETMAAYPDYELHVRGVCVAANEAAMLWKATIGRGEAARELSGVDIIELDESGLIASVHAYWDRSRAASG